MVKTYLYNISRFILISVCISYCIGIVISQFFQYNLTLLFPSLITATISIFVTYRRKKLTATLFLLATFLLFGLFVGTKSRLAPSSPHHIYNQILHETDSVIVGTVIEMHQTSYDRAKIILQLKAMRSSSDQNLSTSVGKIIIWLYDTPTTIYEPGQLLAIRGKLSRPSPLRTPGSFDYTAYLKNNQIWITGATKSSRLISPVLDEQKTFQTDYLRHLPNKIRQNIKELINSSVSTEVAPLYRAILIGDKTTLPDTIIDGFKHSGTMHILAVSGLHMSILAFFSYSFLYFLLSRSTLLINKINIIKTAAVGSVLPLAFYALISGMNPPIIRSFIMSLCLIAALSMDRRKSPLTIVAFAALLILIISPAVLFTPSFQLSFAAVSTIILSTTIFPTFVSNLKKGILTPLRWAMTMVYVSFFASLGTLPLVLYHFNYLSMIGPISNLILEPLICLWALPFGFIAIAVSHLLPELSNILFTVGSLGLYLANIINEMFLTYHWLSGMQPTPQVSLIAAYYLFLLWFIKTKSVHRRIFSGLLIMIVIIFMTIIPIEEITKHFNKTSRLSFIYVGQGSSTLIETPEGIRILIDGGGSYSQTTNAGEKFIIPYIHNLGIKKLDHIFITHPDRDHFDGIEDIVKEFSPSHLWISNITTSDPKYLALIKMTKSKGIQVNKITKKSLYNEKNIAVKELTYGYNLDPVSNTDNDNGLIIKFTHGEFSCLFPGDISILKEKQLVNLGIDVSADVLLSPHHGSTTSNSKVFLNAVEPGLTIVSSAGSESFPSLKTINTFKELDIQYLTTARNGTVVVETDGEKFNIKTFLP